MNQLMKAAYGVVAAFAHVEQENAQFSMLLMLTERDGEVDLENEQIALWPGRENPISGSKETYVMQKRKGDSFP